MNKTERINKRAVKAGRRLATKCDGKISQDDLLGMKIQTMPLWSRLILLSSGSLGCLFGFTGWPVEHVLAQIVAVLLGLFLISWGIFGAKKTLSNVMDGLDAATSSDLLEGIVDGVGSAITSVIDI